MFTQIFAVWFGIFFFHLISISLQLDDLFLQFFNNLFLLFNFLFKVTNIYIFSYEKFLQILVNKLRFLLSFLFERNYFKFQIVYLLIILVSDFSYFFLIHFLLIKQVLLILVFFLLNKRLHWLKITIKLFGQFPQLLFQFGDLHFFQIFRIDFIIKSI